MKYANMTNEAIRSRIRELEVVLNGDPCADAWSVAYGEYAALNAVLDERWRQENQADFDAFYAAHIEGKAWDEIDPNDWGFYSDWHKDMYGFRPHRI